jgi:hypothetical protein
MATYTKLPLSASLYGKQILIAATTSASAQPIHTTPPTTNSIDEIWLYAYNDLLSSVVLAFNWGGSSEPADVVRTVVLPQGGRTLVVDGKLLQNGLTVYAYTTGSANVVNIDGFVNRITS